MQARVATVLLVLGVAIVAAPMAALVGAHEWWPFALCVAVLALATAGAIVYVQLHDRQRQD